ncbi:MAG TPA: FAD-dependent oxidoreductase [Patescibacteria group bacterium]|nr:FAD-dependent oxidoreductase [Patescibacteria group bacterium]
MQTIDAVLNRFTMYKVLLYGLMALWVIAEVLAVTGAISVSAGGLAVSAVVLGVTCYGVTAVLARLLRTPYNSESYLISALILLFVMPPATSVGRTALLALTAAVAMASKYVLVYRGSHIFNPVALGAFVLSVTGLLPATWWLATPWLTPFSILLALLVLRKQRKFTLFFSFAVAAVVMLLYVSSGLHHQATGTVLHDALLSWPIIFFGSIMLSEPTTLPPAPFYQILLAVLVAALFSSQLKWGPVSATPEAALLVGNLFGLFVAPPYGATLRVKQLTQLSADIYDLALDKPAGGVPYAPGQYMYWTLRHSRADIRGNRRTFSIASSPTEPELHVGFRRYLHGSTYKQALLQLTAGDTLRAAKVGGSFTLPEDPTQALLWIAGGIGITPFRSMAKYLSDKGEERDIILVYQASSEQDFVYKDIFAQAAPIGLKTEYVVGRIKPTNLQRNDYSLAERLVYISGPDSMVTSYKQALRSMGVPNSRIKTDYFSGY